MSAAPTGLNEVLSRTFPFPKRHFLSVVDLNPVEVTALLDLADSFAEAYIGSYGLIAFSDTPYEPHTDALKLLDELDEVVDSARDALNKGDTHLMSILDEITALVASTRYKLRFLK